MKIIKLIGVTATMCVTSLAASNSGVPAARILSGKFLTSSDDIGADSVISQRTAFIR